MRVLFIHQNFPGQFKHLAPALAAQGHTVVGLTLQKVNATEWQGVQQIPYAVQRGSTPNVHPWVSDFETKTIRGEACFRAALRLKAQGFNPAIIIAHPGWGESLFLKDVWPHAPLIAYCEFFYHREGADIGFDPEFPVTDPGEVCRLRLKNLNNLLHFDVADVGLSPTHWQASTFPEPFRHRISVIHDGIDTRQVVPNPQACLQLNQCGLELRAGDEIITFVNRNLEPMRGFHAFLRTLPEIQRRRPQACILIVGGDEVSYGSPLPGGQTYRQKYLNEQAGQLDLSRIHFVGKVPYAVFLGLLQVSAVHVYLTYPFVLSWSMLEAMSAGCLVVGSRTPPVEEVITHGHNGLLVDFFKPHEIADVVEEVLKHPDRMQAIRTRARQTIIDHYDLHTVCLPAQLALIEAIAQRTVPTPISLHS